MQKSDWRYEIDLVEGPLAFLGIKKAVETGVKSLPIVTVVVLFNIDESVSSIKPVSLECLNELLNSCKSLEL